jgi:putative hydrolase of the HAD superfamily
MDGRTDISTAMAVVLRDFSVAADVEDVLELWTRIQPHADMIDAVADLRRNGVRCCLTTNQQTRRAAWMRSHLGYDLVFDEEFYSCELGVAKPDPAYFSTVLEALDVKAATVLFVDDTEANVDAARTVGLNAEVFPRHGGRSALEEILRGYVVLGR